MKDKTIKIDLSKIANTALQEKVDKELEKVLENILDLNTEAKATRKVTITLTMSTDDERTVVKTGMEVKSTLAPQKGVATTVIVGRDDTGKIHANELKSGIPGQTYFEVSVYDQVDFENGKRPQLVSVRASVPVIPFSNWRDQEEFNIMLQSMFINDADRNLVLDFASHLKIEKGAEVQDNGISQMATVRDGVASLAQAKTPNPVTLRPYRTFNEVEQPASQFVFRINKSANLALFEADGGKWKLEAVESVANYLKNELASNKEITILA